MLSIERVKQLLKDTSLSDDDAEKIRDEFRVLAEIIYEQWLKKINSDQSLSNLKNNH